MPTYQYSCTDCGHFLEAVQSFSDASLTTCPVCEGQLRKVFNAVGVVFKGSGFYRTDSRGPDKSGASGSSKKSADPSTASSTPASKPAETSASPSTSTVSSGG